ncbi:MAG: Ig-like domain-containing protein, partial [Gemmatimonadales bacterium]
TFLRAVLGGGILVFTACGSTEPAAGGEPGTLVLTVDGVDEVTSDSIVQLTGALTRSPPADTPLSVTISGGAAAVTATADEQGRFAADVRLRLDQSNTLTLTPKDGTGSMGQPVTVTILHDGSGPMVVMMTPSGDGLGTSAPTVEVQLSEPVRESGPGAGMSLASGPFTVPGTSVLASDSVTFTFMPTPGTVLPENSIFSVAFQGVTDAAGNVPAVGTNACFVTHLTVPAMNQFPDTTRANQDILGFFTQGGPQPQFIDPADIDQVRTGIQDSVLTVVTRFTNDRSFDLADSNNTFVLIDIDIDQDSTTGSRTFRDSLFIFTGLPTRTSGMGADYGVFVDHLPEVGDSAVVAQYTGIWVDGGPEFNALDVFWPSFCGPFIGVRVALSLLGGDEGNMNVSVMAFNVEGPSLDDPIVVDLAPDSMAFNLNYGGLFTPPLRAATVLRPALRRVIYRRLLPYLIQR